MFRLCDAKMYTAMAKNIPDLTIDRGVALHKIIRLLTMTLGGDGYLNFMGNEFGHPEWIDFPREGNGWSYHYCRRQWSLADDPNLKYEYLQNFDRDAVKLCKQLRTLTGKDTQLWVDNDKKLLVYRKGKGIFAYNLQPEDALDGCFVRVDAPGEYEVIMSTDDFCYGGFGRVYHQRYKTVENDGNYGIKLYIPNRTAVVLRKV